MAAEILRDHIEACGGLLKVGIYAPQFEVTDLHAKLSAFHTTLVKHVCTPWSNAGSPT
jgi:hypothetical protein